MIVESADTCGLWIGVQCVITLYKNNLLSLTHTTLYPPTGQSRLGNITALRPLVRYIVSVYVDHRGVSFEQQKLPPHIIWAIFILFHGQFSFYFRQGQRGV